jgi:hypothetical protein
MVYAPGETAPVSGARRLPRLPLAQRDDGAVFEDVVETTVAGRPATILTATAPHNLDDSIGCTVDDGLVSDCFGLLSDLILRIAVLDTDQGPLLVWGRDARGDDSESEYETFEAMLSSLHFRPTPPQHPRYWKPQSQEQAIRSCPRATTARPS